MPAWAEIAIAVVGSVFASSGFWALIMALYNKKNAKTKMILGLGHDRVIFLCLKYIERGWITSDEHEDLNKYLYEPYLAMKGNGTAERLMAAVNELPIKKLTYIEQIKNHQNENKSQQNPKKVGVNV